MTWDAENFDQNDTFTDEFYSNYMDKEGLIEQWWLTSSPVPTVSILLLYLLIVLRLGPAFMENRPPYNLKWIMRVYNIVQVMYNSAILYHYFVPVNGNLPVTFVIRVSCSIPKPFEGVDYLKYMYVVGGWHFQVLKVMDLLDTIFIILRKKSSHITFLHVYHHGAMVFFPWFSLRYIKATQGAIPVFINIIVHAVMYTYYFLATFGAFKKYLWWKRHLTKLQLLQFVIIIVYIGFLYYNQCQISRMFTYIWLFNVVAIFFLFLNFYVRAYIIKQDKDKENKVS